MDSKILLTVLLFVYVTSEGGCTCPSGFYGSNCEQPCDSRCLNCSSDSACTSCPNGMYGTFCQHTCPSSCKTCNQLTTGSISCTSCHDGYFDYNDTCGSPCQSKCKICSSYFICHECKDGYWGTQCGLPCSPGCINRTCDRYEHTCECKYGFIGDICIRCVDGKWGLINDTCDRDCSSGCSKKLCDSYNGICKFGCNDGYWEKTCTKKCSQFCKDEICDIESGQCTRGCENGFVGPKCVCQSVCAECSSEGNCYRCDEGYFESNGTCIQCPSRCYKALCESDGYCIEGCILGFFGHRCDKECDKNCNLRMCFRANGSCIHGCKAGYTSSGEVCITVNEHNREDSTSALSPVVIGLVAVSVMLAVIVAVVVAVCVVIKRRKANKNASKSEDAQDYATVNELTQEKCTVDRNYTSLQHPTQDSVNEYESINEDLSSQSTTANTTQQNTEMCYYNLNV